MDERVAVVLFNLGGPDRPAAVRPFLFNLFNDRAIIELRQPFRWLLARLISARRAKSAEAIYATLGGGSPLLENTRAQAAALQAALGAEGAQIRVFVAMRYWHPMAVETAAAVRDFAPDRIVLLPLYPQYSGTTSGSSLADWDRAAARVGLTRPARAACCYPDVPGWVDALARLTAEAYRAAETASRSAGEPPPRILFSAHGLPERVVAAGDPYAWQVRRTAEAVVAALAAGPAGIASPDWTLCYQSRVGPLAWIQPYTEAEIRRAGEDGVPVVVVPVAFVSEHSETLVELDREYAELAEASGVPSYHRVPAVATDPQFIDALAGVVRSLMTPGAALCAFGPGGPAAGRTCPAEHGRCAWSRVA